MSNLKRAHDHLQNVISRSLARFWESFALGTTMLGSTIDFIVLNHKTHPFSISTTFERKFIFQIPNIFSDLNNPPVRKVGSGLKKKGVLTRVF